MPLTRSSLYYEHSKERRPRGEALILRGLFRRNTHRERERERGETAGSLGGVKMGGGCVGNESNAEGFFF